MAPVQDIRASQRLLSYVGAYTSSPPSSRHPLRGSDRSLWPPARRSQRFPGRLEAELPAPACAAWVVGLHAINSAGSSHFIEVPSHQSWNWNSPPLEQNLSFICFMFSSVGSHSPKERVNTCKHTFRNKECRLVFWRWPSVSDIPDWMTNCQPPRPKPGLGAFVGQPNRSIGTFTTTTTTTTTTRTWTQPPNMRRPKEIQSNIPSTISKWLIVDRGEWLAVFHLSNCL